MGAGSNNTLPGIAQSALGLALSRLRYGRLTLVAPGGAERVFEGAKPGPDARIDVSRDRAAWRAIVDGSMGLAEGYLAGDWDTPDLDAVLSLGVANLTHKPAGAHSAFAPLHRAYHALRDNSLSGSKRNIESHYDLGNDFYRLWLDETMTYSSALFEADETSSNALVTAQRRKWDRMLELLQPSSGDHILEIGCGWGGFAMHAAREAGCKVTGVTLSNEQHAWATSAAEQAGLDDRVAFRLQDYRDIGEQFSAVASIEMFEAVGEKWWPVFFSRLAELTGPGRPVALQTITIEDHRFEDYRDKPDFVQRYVFPGGMLPSPERFVAAAGAAGLRADEPLFFGASYAATLAAWQERFEAAVPAVLALGFDERFLRLWRYYLAYCRAGFSGKTIDVMQVRLEG
ncbi:MAG: class I SAM-dependent methyltransferase [Coriobacteriia bacterium]|nr:class I SAM-dependent methyltransferase [Coriobacteriia bacterium]